MGLRFAGTDTSTGMLIRTIALFVALVGVTGTWAAPSTFKAITTAAKIRSLNPRQASEELPVAIRGVVTYVNLPTGELFVQDHSAGIFVFVRNSTSSAPLTAGQEVKLEGVTAPGDFSSSITRARIRVIGKGRFPVAHQLPSEAALSGEQDSQWGFLAGIVRSGHEESGILYLNAVTSGGPFLVIVKDYPATWQSTLIDSRVLFEGVLAAQFNEHRQVTGTRIFVPFRGFMHVMEPAVASPYDLPQSSTVSVGAFRPKQESIHRIRVRTSVTAIVSKELIYVSDGEGNLPVELSSPCASAAGSRVDVVGFPGTLDGRPALHNTICRIATPGPEIQAAVLSATEIVPRQNATEGTGLSIAKGTRNDLRVVTVSGTVVDITNGTLFQTLTMISDDQTFTVSVPAAVAAQVYFQSAMQLKVTGVCLITYDEYHRAQSFRILSRTRQDLAIVSRPPWLTLVEACGLYFR